MKKILALLLASLTLAGCTHQPQREIQSERYTVTNCCYYTNGTVETSDGMLWGYTTEIISNTAVYDGMPVIMCMDDKGTANIIEDDIVLGLVYDRETAIYDALADSFSKGNIEYERNGNYISLTFKGK
jgi:hypothetical protein